MTEKELLEREEFLEDILDALEDGDYEEAEDLADEAIEEFPNEAFGYYYLGEAIFLQGDAEDAVEHYQKAVEMAPDNPDYKARLALMYAKVEEEDKAKQIYQAVLELKDDHVDALVSLGVYALNDEDYDGALVHLNKAVTAKADYCDAYKIRAIVHTTLNNYKEALADVNSSLAIEPNDNEMWQQKISLLKSQGDAAGTMKAFKDWVALDEEDTRRHERYAGYCMEQEDYKEAEAAYTMAIEKEAYGDFAAIHSFIGRGWARLGQDKTGDAVSDFSRVIELDAKVIDSYLGLADAKAKEGNVDGAATYLDLGLDIVLEERWMLMNKKGVLYVQAGNYDAAEAAFKEMLSTEDEEIQAEGHFSMGKLYQAKGDLEAAFRSWRKASDIFHLEADQHIEDYCQEFISKELKEKEANLVGDMQADFDANKKSPILGKLFNKYWKVDIKTTSSKNDMFAQMPAKMEKQIMSLLENISLGIVHKGVIVLNPGQSGVRMLYSIKDETAKAVTINGIPLNGTNERNFTLTPAGSHLMLRGFGEEGADIDLFLENTPFDKLPKTTQEAFKKANTAGDLDFMGDAFKGTLA